MCACKHSEWVNTHMPSVMMSTDIHVVNVKSPISVCWAHNYRHVILHTPVLPLTDHKDKRDTNASIYKWAPAPFPEKWSRQLHIHTFARIWLMSKWKQCQRASLPPSLGQLLFHHSPPLSPDNSCTTPAAHHSLPNTVGCINTAHSHIRRGRTVGARLGL